MGARRKARLNFTSFSAGKSGCFPAEVFRHGCIKAFTSTSSEGTVPFAREYVHKLVWHQYICSSLDMLTRKCNSAIRILLHSEVIRFLYLKIIFLCWKIQYYITVYITNALCVESEHVHERKYGFVCSSKESNRCMTFWKMGFAWNIFTCSWKYGREVVRCEGFCGTLMEAWVKLHECAYTCMCSNAFLQFKAIAFIDFFPELKFHMCDYFFYSFEYRSRACAAFTTSQIVMDPTINARIYEW